MRTNDGFISKEKPRHAGRGRPPKEVIPGEEIENGNKMIQSRIAAFEDKINSHDVLDRIWHRTLKECYPNWDMRSYGYEERAAKIYRKLKNNKATADEVYEWHWSITSIAADKLCKLADYFLVSGPLTLSDSNLLDSLLVLLKQYYSEKSNYIKLHNIPYTLILDLVFIPSSNSSSFTALSDFADFNLILQMINNEPDK